MNKMQVFAKENKTMKVANSLVLLLMFASVLFSQAGDQNATQPDFSPLIRILSTKPYVEQECKDTTFTNWPYELKICTYSTNSPIGKNLRVIVANPSVEQLEKWIVDAGDQIDGIKYLKEKDPAHYVKSLVEIGRFVRMQSSFIFPLDGQIWEDMLGDGVGRVYIFQKGVTKTKSARGGRYCRIVSLTREEYANYVFAKIDSTVTTDSVLSKLMLYQNWCDKCFELHKQAWNSERHEGFRAKAHKWNQLFLKKNPKFCTTMSPAEIVAELKRIINNN